MRENRVFIGLGTNLGNRRQNIKKALEELSKFIKINGKSKIIETDPIGYKEQPRFLNMVVEATTSISSTQLLKTLKSIEKDLGRKKTFRYGPRIIDLDILIYGHRIVRQKNLKIPHPELTKRDFVLKPLSELTGKTISELKKEYGQKED